MEGGDEMLGPGFPGSRQAPFQPLAFPVVHQMVVFPEPGHAGQVPAPGAAQGHVSGLEEGVVEKMHLGGRAASIFFKEFHQ